jgi:hypothetical protein
MLAVLLIFTPVAFRNGVLKPTVLSLLAVGIPLVAFLWVTIGMLAIVPGRGLIRDFEDNYSVSGEGDYLRVDERETALRDRAHYHAMRIVTVVFIWGCLSTSLFSERLLPAMKDGAWTFFSLLLLLFPRTIILWSEQDIER